MCGHGATAMLAVQTVCRLVLRGSIGVNTDSLYIFSVPMGGGPVRLQLFGLVHKTAFARQGIAGMREAADMFCQEAREVLCSSLRAGVLRDASCPMVAASPRLTGLGAVGSRSSAQLSGAELSAKGRAGGAPSNGTLSSGPVFG